MLAKRLRMCCEKVSPHKFAKSLYADQAKYITTLAFEHHKQLGGGADMMDHYGAICAFYLCANSALHDFNVEVPNVNKIKSEEVLPLRKLFDNVLVAVTNKYVSASFSTNFNLRVVADEFIVAANRDTEFFSSYSRITTSHGERCLYSEWLIFFRDFKSQKENQNKSPVFKVPKHTTPKPKKPTSQPKPSSSDVKKTETKKRVAKKPKTARPKPVARMPDDISTLGASIQTSEGDTHEKRQDVSEAVPEITHEVESEFYAQAFKEIENGKTSTSEWARAFSEVEGDEKKAQALYIKIRVKSLVEDTLSKGEEKRLQSIDTEIAKLEKERRKQIEKVVSEKEQIMLKEWRTKKNLC